MLRVLFLSQAEQSAMGLDNETVFKCNIVFMFYTTLNDIRNIKVNILCIVYWNLVSVSFILFFSIM